MKKRTKKKTERRQRHASQHRPVKKMMALTRRLLIDLSSRRRLFNAGKFSTTHKKKPVLHEGINLIIIINVVVLVREYI